MDITERKQLRRILGVIAAATAVICLIALFFFRTNLFAGAAGRMTEIAMPFIYGAAIAYLLLPVCEFFERLFAKWLDRGETGARRGAIRMLAILLSLLVLFAVLYFLIMAILPEVISSISGLLGQLPEALDRFQNWIGGLDTSDMSHETVTTVQSAVGTLSDYVSDFLQTDLLPHLQTMISDVTSSFMSLLSVLKNIGLGCVISAYILAGRERFAAQAKLVVYAVFPKRAADWLRDEIHYADRMFSGFIRGKLLDSLIIGVICFVFSLLAGLPYAVLVSIVVGVTNIIPFFGPYMGAIPSAILILTVSPTKCLVFLVFIIILQQLDGNVIGPRILGDRVGLSGFWILFSILVFGSLWGFVGMVVGVPTFAVLYDIVRDIVLACLRWRGQLPLAEAYGRTYHGQKELKAKGEETEGDADSDHSAR